MTENKGGLLSPNEITKRQVRKSQRIVENKEEEKAVKEVAVEGDKFVNTAGKVRINFETLGRFDIPKTLHFDDYSGAHVVDISMSNEENFVETLLTIMQDLMQENDKYNIGDMLPQEFLEAMVGVKIKFNTPNHDHKWLCDCQMNETNKDPHSMMIDLRKLNYVSILESDNKLKEYFKPYFENITDERFQNYLELKYGDEEEVINFQDYDKNEELDKIKLEEPITQIVGEQKDIYKFRFTRMKDIITAQKIVDKKYAVDIKKIEMKKTHGVKKIELDLEKDKEMQRIQTKKVKDLINIVKALTLIKVNNEELTDNNRKIELYKAIKRKELLEFTNFLDYINFGIQDKRTFECDLCGKSEGRLLQREFDPYEFIPLDTSADESIREHSRGTIFLGI